MTVISIRQGHKADAENIANMLIQLAKELGDGDVFSTDGDIIERFGFGDKPMFETAIAEIDHVAIGMVLYFPHFSTTKGKPGVYVQDLWIRGDMRGKKVGQKLLTYVAERAEKSWDAGYIKLSVHTDNPRAKQFYLRLGFNASTNETPMTVDLDVLRGLI